MGTPADACAAQFEPVPESWIFADGHHAVNSSPNAHVEAPQPDLAGVNLARRLPSCVGWQSSVYVTSDVKVDSGP